MPSATRLASADRSSSQGTKNALKRGMGPLLTSTAVLSAGIVYGFPLRRWFATWGSTLEERQRAMTADFEVPAASYSTTLAVTVDARPEDVWPWLLQMGFRRGGLYSYDWLDRLFGYLDRPSTDHILREFQNLNVGDVIPIGRGGGFPVRAIEPNRSLVLGGSAEDFDWVWEFGLSRRDDGRTRLVSRNRARVPKNVTSWCLMRLLEPAAFLMTRRMLLGLKRRSERLARTRAYRSPQPA